MSYKLVIADRFEKKLSKLPKYIAKRLRPRIRALANYPRPAGVKKLQGKRSEYRLRLGDYRLIYRVNDQDRTITIWDIGPRGSIYR